jgi:hypothetical protein
MDVHKSPRRDEIAAPKDLEDRPQGCEPDQEGSLLKRRAERIQRTRGFSSGTIGAALEKLNRLIRYLFRKRG